MIFLSLLLLGCPSMDGFKDGDGDGVSFDHGDCNDADPTVFPGATETADDRDEDCDGVIDDHTEEYDDDQDGYTEVSGDCDDTLSAVHPGAIEVVDSLDQDCNGLIDDQTTIYDDDGDNYTEIMGDCDDTDRSVFPFAVEVADDKDQDCNGLIDDGTSDYDDDGDTFTEVSGDCDDVSPHTYPGATEVVDGVDQDCDGIIDEETDFYDDDGDGVAEQGGDCDDTDREVYPSVIESYNFTDDDCDGITDEETIGYDDDGDGFSELLGDCDDTDAGVAPYQTETADGRDQDCDGIIDEATTVSDDDLDGWSEDEGDCDDGAVGVNPAAMESCNGVDDDCSGVVDDQDEDGDGYTTLACGGEDCDDRSAAVHPGMTENTGNSIDDNCDTNIDEGGIVPAGTLASLADDVEMPDSTSDDADVVPSCTSEAMWSSYEPFTAVQWLPVRVVRIANDDGTGAVDSEDISEALADANEDFAAMGVQFYDTAFETWAESDWVSVNSDEFSTLRSDWASDEEMEDVLTIFVAPDSDNVCGVGTFPGTPNPGVLLIGDSGCLTGRTLSHEIGHYFGLYHTHQGTGFGSTTNGPEAVDGSNCTTAGDLVCATPADPGPYNSTTNPDGCSYTTATCSVSSCASSDMDGNDYDPDVSNHMSYYSGCRTSFTTEQEQRMLCVLDQYRDGLLQTEAEYPSSSMHVVEDRAYLTPNGSATISLSRPAEAESCTPFVFWEKFIEHDDDQCDYTATIDDASDPVTVSVSVEHCGYGWYGSTYAAVARAALFCFDDEGYAESTELTRGGPLSTTIPYPDAAAAEVEALCSINYMDGDGDTDFGGTCSATLGTSGLEASLSYGCEASDKEDIQAQYLLLGTPDDVNMQVESFEVAAGDTVEIVHIYDPSYVDHLSFVIPNNVDTGCNDHGSFESSCVDDGSMVVCTVTAYGSIAGIAGQVLFLDGSFPEARSARP